MTNIEKTVLEKLIDELRAELSTTQLNCDMWHDRAEDMRNRLSAAQSENAKLREERREYQATIDSLVDECTDHKAENAKLRKLCADLRFCRRNNCLTCSHGRFCDMRFDERYAEMGIEMSA